jgi:hypothetical protein
VPDLSFKNRLSSHRAFSHTVNVKKFLVTDAHCYKMKDVSIRFFDSICYLQTSEELFLIEDSLTRKEAVQLLEKKVGGSFLVRKSDKNDTYAITAKATREQIYHGNGRFSHFLVKEALYKDQKYYYIRKGEGFASLLELVVHHKHDFGFYYPMKHEGKVFFTLSLLSLLLFMIQSC